MSSSAAHALRAALEADVECTERLELLFSKEPDAKQFVDYVFKDALEFPGPIKQIPKATLVVGAGKLERAKFAEDLPKWIMTALQKLGYQEDRGASALLACQGTFKFQHDVGKNEKYVQVFPLVKQVEAAKQEGEEDGERGEEERKQDPESMCLEATVKTFEEMSQRKMRSWMSKKRCSQMLKQKHEKMELAQEKLVNRIALSEEEQYLFDSAVQLEEKLAVLRGEMLQLVDEGKVNKLEREEALTQLRQRMKEVALPTEAMKARLTLLESQAGNAGYRHPFDNEQRMNQLWQRSAGLAALVEKAGPKGRWSSALNAQEVQKLGEKEEWDHELQVLISRARFWFETEEELQLRAKLAKAAVVKAKPVRQSATTATVATSSQKPQAALSWSTVGKSSTASKSTSNSNKPGSVKNAFASLGDDSD
ncbi:hypothetical protein BASA81_002052 [Batrachochytrium salamandrivorans]|nr:hypothetical protein BASA81_002052 [Batrachochytrium salamandrivorans]